MEKKPVAPKGRARQQQASVHEGENFRNERSPAELAAEDAKKTEELNRVLPDKQQSGWVTRN